MAIVSSTNDQPLVGTTVHTGKVFKTAKILVADCVGCQAKHTVRVRGCCVHDHCAVYLT